MFVSGIIPRVGGGHEGAPQASVQSLLDNLEELRGVKSINQLNLNPMSDGPPQNKSYLSQLVVLQATDALIQFLSKGRVINTSMRSKIEVDQPSLEVDEVQLPDPFKRKSEQEEKDDEEQEQDREQARQEVEEQMRRRLLSKMDNDEDPPASANES